MGSRRSSQQCLRRPSDPAVRRPGRGSPNRPRLAARSIRRRRDPSPRPARCERCGCRDSKSMARGPVLMSISGRAGSVDSVNHGFRGRMVRSWATIGGNKAVASPSGHTVAARLEVVESPSAASRPMFAHRLLPGQDSIFRGPVHWLASSYLVILSEKCVRIGPASLPRAQRHCAHPNSNT